MWDRIILGTLGLWALIFGIIHVSNIRVDSANTVMGWSALILGGICIVRLLVSFSTPKAP
jgi:uncharacterized membrane protein